MPLFMVISGYFSRSSLTITFKGVLSKKGRQLLIPCISGWLVIFMTHVIIPKMSQYEIGSMEYFKWLLWHFWFLKTLFVCYLIAWVANKFSRDSIIRFVFWGIVFSRIANIHDIPTMYLFFLFGILLRRFNKDTFSKKIEVSCLSIYMLCFLLVRNISIKPVCLVTFINSSFTFLDFIYEILHVAQALSMVVLLIALSSRISFKNKVAEFLVFAGKHTLAMYWLQVIFLETILAFYVKGIHNPLLLFVCAIVLFCLFYFISKLLMRNKFSAHILFGKTLSE